MQSLVVSLLHGQMDLRLGLSIFEPTRSTSESQVSSASGWAVLASIEHGIPGMVTNGH